MRGSDRKAARAFYLLLPNVSSLLDISFDPLAENQNAPGHFLMC
jgi:hypothetical protein